MNRSANKTSSNTATKKVIAAAIFALALAAAALALCSCSSTDYKPTAKGASVADTALVKSGTLTVGVNASNPPMAGQSSSIVGIDADIAAALADELGLSLELVDVKTDGEAALENKRVDMLLGVDSSTNPKSSMWVSDDYMQTGIALFSTSSSAATPKTTDTTNFSAQASSVSAWTISNQFGASRLVSTNDLSSTFQNLANGTTNFAVADAVVGMYAAHSAGITAYITSMVTAPTGYRAEMLGSNTTLQTSVRSTLKNITDNGVVEIIQKKWLGTKLQLSNLSVTEQTVAAEKGTTTNSTENTHTNTNSNENTNANSNTNSNENSATSTTTATS